MAERIRREAAAVREQRMQALAAQQEQAWQRVTFMIETRKPGE